MTHGSHLVLHIGACDYAASVWANGQLVGTHEGGHTPFCCNLEPASGGGEIEIVIRASDDPTDISQPRGKQDWSDDPHGVWYPRDNRPVAAGLAGSPAGSVYIGAQLAAGPRARRDRL